MPSNLSAPPDVPAPRMPAPPAFHPPVPVTPPAEWPESVLVPPASRKLWAPPVPGAGTVVNSVVLPMHEDAQRRRTIHHPFVRMLDLRSADTVKVRSSM